MGILSHQTKMFFNLQFLQNLGCQIIFDCFYTPRWLSILEGFKKTRYINRYEHMALIN